MGIEILTVYDTDRLIDSQTTPDLLAQLLFEYVPRSLQWISLPDDDDPTGERWVPQWSSISDAVSEIEQFLGSPAARQMEVPGFEVDDLIDELQLFRDELQAASNYTTRFHLCVY